MPSLWRTPLRMCCIFASWENSGKLTDWLAKRHHHCKLSLVVIALLLCAAILLGLQSMIPYFVLCCIELFKVHLASNCWNPFLAHGKKSASPSRRDCVWVLQTGLQKGEDSYPTPWVVQIFWQLRRKLKLTDLTWTWKCHSLTFGGVYCAPREEQSGE